MKRVCAWCGEALDNKQLLATVDITHGVCPSCRHEFFATKKKDNPTAREPSASPENEALLQEGMKTP